MASKPGGDNLIDEKAAEHTDRPVFSATYAAEPTAVGTIRAALVAFATEAGVSKSQIEAVRLAASEAATNAVVHAYEPGGAGAIDVSAELEDCVLTILFEDAGPGLGTRSPRPGLGVGLTVIGRLANHVALSTSGAGGLRLVMSFDRQ